MSKDENGVTITKDEFKKMKQSEQLAVIFENTESLRQDMSRLKFQQKVMGVMIAAVWIVLGTWVIPHIIK